MKILNLSYDDYANFAHENANALRSVGIDVMDLKKIKHPFSYDSESKIATSSEIKRAIEKSDLIQLFHTDSTWLKYAYDLGKRVVVYHTGTTYRQNSEFCNKIFNSYVERCFTDQCEFIGLGMKNETYIATAINTEKFKPIHKEVSDPYLIAHYPSNKFVKGTDKISEMLSKIEGANFTINTERVSHENQIMRMNLCDIYIELFAPKQGEKQYGCFGVTAFESAALGKITNNSNQKAYSDAYGKCSLLIANTEEEFMNFLNVLIDMQPFEIISLQQEARNWVVEKHSYQATGNYLKKCLNL
jgi:hypothetical protein